jgi:hypothetical protein
MKKGKLNTVDGSEFTVFYLKGEPEVKPLADYHDPDHPLNIHDEGQMYWTGNIFDDPNKLIAEGKKDWGYNEQDVNENSAGEGVHAAPLKKFKWKTNPDENFNKNKKSFMDKVLDEIKKQHDHQLEEVVESLPLIDDSIESDVISNPIFNHVYKIKTLNKLAMFKGHSLVEGVHSVRWYAMDCHGLRFHVPEGTLLKASAQECDIYSKIETKY